MLNINFKLRPVLSSYGLNILVSSNTIQILPLNVNKAKLFDTIDLSLEMYLFGDSDNDLELFKKGRELNKVIYLVGENHNLKPYATASIKGISEVFVHLQSNF